MSFHFAWKCSYRHSVWFEIHDASGRYEAELIRKPTPYADSQYNGNAAEYARDVEASAGILRRSVCDAAGEIAAETIAAFNAWRAAEHAAQIAHMRAHPERYGTDFESDPWFQAPAPVMAGRWTRGAGWSRIAEKAVAA